MTSANFALLPDRGVVRLEGTDAENLLQGLITNDMGKLAQPGMLYAGLLTPQGKILFDFFVTRHGDSFLLETAAAHTGQLAKRLVMYRLRARVDITDASQQFRVLAAWGALPQSGGHAALADPRLPALGVRILLGPHLPPPGEPADVNATAADYHAYRISLGVPEGGKDYAFGDTFPHEANFDMLNGISFTKGCFVGQEVVSRMQHRGGARKRIVIVEAEAPLEPGAEITAGAASIGTVGSVAGQRALALVRLDRAQEVTAEGAPLTAGGVRLKIHLPDYLAPALRPTAVAP